MQQYADIYLLQSHSTCYLLACLLINLHNYLLTCLLTCIITYLLAYLLA